MINRRSFISFPKFGMKRLSQKGKEFINKPNEFSMNSFIKNARLFNERHIDKMFLNQYKIKVTNSLSTKISAVSFKAKILIILVFIKKVLIKITTYLVIILRIIN